MNRNYLLKRASQPASVVLFVMALLFPVVTFSACQNDNAAPYKTLMQNEGIVHFSFEYPSDYILDYQHNAEETGGFIQRSAGAFLMGPKTRHINDYTYISVGASPPDDLVPNAKTAIERAETNAASWADYKLLNKCEISVDGLQAYRIDYQIRDIVPAIAGGQTSIAIYRCVHFNAKGFVWSMTLDSNFATAETDKAAFEHVLETFKILD